MNQQNVSNNPDARLAALIEAADGVLLNWESGDLAGAVNDLRLAANEAKGGGEVDNARVVITVQGGVVQGVDNPFDIPAEVHDYDMEGSSPDELEADAAEGRAAQDEDGDWYAIGHY